MDCGNDFDVYVAAAGCVFAGGFGVENCSVAVVFCGEK